LIFTFMQKPVSRPSLVTSIHGTEPAQAAGPPASDEAEHSHRSFGCGELGRLILRSPDETMLLEPLPQQHFVRARFLHPTKHLPSVT
jgi:hypothetical protein